MWIYGGRNEQHCIVVSQGLNVLVVDDSSMSRKMVCKALQFSKQCVCDQAADGAIAVDMVQQRITGIHVL